LVIEKLPGIIPEKLVGGVMYHDGQFDDARLAINLAQTIFDKGGYAINYMKVIDLLKEGETVSGITLTDKETDTDYLIQSKVVVNATGVFVDEILQMDLPGGKRNIAASQGIHLVLDQNFFPGTDAMMIPETSDGRVLFIVPWHNKLLIGTTDTPVKNISLEPVAMEKEIDFILNTASLYLTKKPSRKDIKSVFAGLRPLAAPSDKKEKTKEISRSHKILVSGSGLFSIIGGKWTTYRKMGEEMIDAIEKKMVWKHIPGSTSHLPIHGFENIISLDDPLYYYGSDKAAIYKIINEKYNDLVSEKLKIYKAQVIWAIQEEMARTVEDVISRRTRALLLDAEESIFKAPLVARIMAEEMGKNETWIRDQEEKFHEVARNYSVDNLPEEKIT
jgi:glycerol-3-phosphate dehydrogenase